MTADVALTSELVSLTAHPLQRVGAFAIAALAGRRHPAEVTETDLTRVVTDMQEDLQATVTLADSKAPGGFWLGVSYMLWPNSPIVPAKRNKQSAKEREAEVRAWRSLAAADATIGVPCALCGMPACGYYGKADVALAASVSQRNTTARHHAGLALCRGCLTCFHALPYGCAIAGGRAAVLHSWDDQFMARAVAVQVLRMRRDAAIAAGRFGDKRPYARQVAALREIRAYEDSLTSGVDLLVFSNSNKDQFLDVHAMSQPLAEWVRTVRHAQAAVNGWRYLTRAHHGPSVPGSSALARNLFDRPGQVITTAARYLRERAASGLPSGESPDLGALCFDYAIKVLDVKTSEADQVRHLAETIASMLNDDGSQFMKFVTACRKPIDLKGWLRRQAISQVRFTRRPEAFITERQWRLLFDPGEDGYLNRDLLFIGTLEKLHALDPKWRADDPSARSDMDDETDEVDQEGEA
jgi:hypothetical protein